MAYSLDRLQQPDGLTWAEKVAYLAVELRERGGSEGWPVEHRVDAGWYIRTVRLPADMVFIGRRHRHGHMCRLISGRTVHITEQQTWVVDAPFMIHTKPGYQMVLHTLTDCVGETWHPVTGPTDFAKYEEDAFEPESDVIRLGEAVRDRLDYNKVLEVAGVTEQLIAPISSEMSDVNTSPTPMYRIGDSWIQGKGVIAKMAFSEGNLIAPLKQGSDRTLAGRYTNHSSKPNARVNGDCWLVATRAIAVGDEITIDYRSWLQ